MTTWNQHNALVIVFAHLGEIIKYALLQLMDLHATFILLESN